MAVAKDNMDAISALMNGASMDDVMSTTGTQDNLPSVASQSGYQPKALTAEGEHVEAELVEDDGGILGRFSKKDAKEPEEEAEEAPEESLEAEGAEDETEQKDVEELWVRDNRGRKKKLVVDYSDREGIKKAYKIMAGARKWQAERDDAIGEFKAYKEEIKPDLDVSYMLQEAYESKGIDGLIEAVGGEGAVEKYLEQKQHERRIWEEASPAERRALEKEREVETVKKGKSELEKRLEELESKLANKDVEYEEKQAQSYLDSAFSKYSFQGSIEDAEQASELDDLMWMRTIKKLDEYPEDVAITKALVDKEMRRAASVLRKFIQDQGTKQANRAVKKQKKKAAESIQNKAKSGLASQGSAKKAKGDFMSALNSGNMLEAVQMWATNKGVRS